MAWIKDRIVLHDGNRWLANVYRPEADDTKGQTIQYIRQLGPSEEYPPRAVEAATPPPPAKPRSTDPNEVMKLPFPLNDAEKLILFKGTREAWNSLGGTRPSSNEQSAAAEDLGNGLVLVDGRIMRKG